MLGELFVTFLRIPGLKKAMWRGWYQILAKRYRGADWTFMNYGFQDDGVPVLALEAVDEPDRYCIQLYHHVASALNLEGQRALEVGCGRGGGAAFVSRYLRPAHMTGVDLSAEAVAFCTVRHNLPGLDFRKGDAEQLPFESETFDAVVNVESSHCYPSLPAFFAEVRRVLKPGGHFLYADLHDSSNLPAWKSVLESSGLIIIAQRDITANVLAALDRDSDRKLAVIKRLVPAFLVESFSDFAGIRGSKLHEGFRSGSLAYCSFVAVKR